jgi:hypothetical protein
MAAGRWAWNCSPGRVLSVATADAGDLRVVAQSQFWDSTSNILAIDSIDTDGTNFLLGEPTLTADGGVTGLIAITDGKAPQTPYLTPTDGSFYDNAVYAGPYVAWLRGIGLQQVNLYTKVEVWASPYDADPTKLVPVKVTDYPFTSMSQLLGAAGRVAFMADDTGTTTTVVNVATHAQSSYTMPNAHQISAPYLGLTSTHLWVAGAPAPSNSNPKDMYLRFAVP